MNNEFEQRVAEFFGQQTNGKLIQSRGIVAGQIENWLKEKAEADRTIKNNYEIMNHIEKLQMGRASAKTEGKFYDISSSGLRQLTENYTQQKREIQKLQDAKSVEELLKDGYRIIHLIRDYLTGEEITYNVLLEGDKDKSGESLMYVNLTLEQILEASSLGFKDILNVTEKTNVTSALKLVVNASSIKKILMNQAEREQKDIENYLSKIQKPALWDSLLKTRDEHFRKYSGNIGQIYEAYFSLTKTRPEIDYIGHEDGKADTIGIGKSAIQKAISDRTPGWKGGDVGSEQLKAVLNGSIASLIQGGSIERTMKKILSLLQENNEKKMINGFIRLFTTDLRKAKTEVDKESAERARKAIEETIKNEFDKK